MPASDTRFPPPPVESSKMLQPLVSREELRTEAKLTGVAVEQFWINCVKDGIAYFFAWHGEPRSTVLVVHNSRNREVTFIEVRTFGDVPVEGPHFRQIAEAVSGAYSVAGYEPWTGNRNTLFDHFSRYVNEQLSLRENYTTETACRDLSKGPLSKFDGGKFVAGMFKLLDVNWSRILDAATEISIGKQNWKFRRVSKISDKNKRPEERLERSLIAACKELGREDWWNQIPVMSGVMGRRSTVDLVHQKARAAFDFIELKATDNETPLSAAIQVTKYGLVFLLSRRDKDRERLGYTDRPLLDADHVTLCVLAPASFYSGYSLSWFERAINDGFRKLGSKHGVKLAFKFLKFPPRFDPRKVEKYRGPKLMGFLDSRKPAF